jgi:hypothetical protein
MSGIRSARRPEKPNHGRRLLLRLCAKWPSRRTAEQTDELAPPHCLSPEA